MKLSQKVAVITGGGSGIGRAAAILMAKEGAKVAIINRTLETAQETVRQLVDEGGCGLAVAADVADSVKCNRQFKPFLMNIKELILCWQMQVLTVYGRR